MSSSSCETLGVFLGRRSESLEAVFLVEWALASFLDASSPESTPREESILLVARTPFGFLHGALSWPRLATMTDPRIAGIWGTPLRLVEH